MKGEKMEVKSINSINQKALFKKVRNNREGITLVSLVVTIIVMLIIAGVTINLTLGENRDIPYRTTSNKKL